MSYYLNLFSNKDKNSVQLVLNNVENFALNINFIYMFINIYILICQCNLCNDLGQLEKY